jgi:hypothetical protein
VQAKCIHVAVHFVLKQHHNVLKYLVLATSWSFPAAVSPNLSVFLR